jgi:hypothetical protein
MNLPRYQKRKTEHKKGLVVGMSETELDKRRSHTSRILGTDWKRRHGALDATNLQHGFERGGLLSGVACGSGLSTSANHRGALQPCQQLSKDKPTKYIYKN